MRAFLISVAALSIPACALLSPARQYSTESGQENSSSALSYAAAHPPRCVDVGRSAIVQGRVGIEDRKGQVTAWVDFELMGPEQAALYVCEALVRSELSTRYPQELGLTPKVARTCSTDGMPEPPASSHWALVKLAKMEPEDLALTTDLRECNAEVMEKLSGHRRDVSNFAEETDCEAMRVKLAEAIAKAQKDARVEAASLMDRLVLKEEETAKSACKADAKSAECKRARSILEMLKDKRKKLDGPPDPESLEDIRVLCRQQ